MCMYKTIKNHFLVKNNIFCQSFQNQVVAVMTVCVPLEACAYPEVRVKQAPPDVTVKTLVPMSTTRYDFFTHIILLLPLPEPVSKQV